MKTYSDHIAQVSTALADPTRREIMEHVLHADTALSVREVADYFGLHANAVRMHLDKLVKGGLLKVVRRRGAHGGRPANLYDASDEDWELNLPRAVTNSWRRYLPGAYRNGKRYRRGAWGRRLSRAAARRRWRTPLPGLHAA